MLSIVYYLRAIVFKSNGRLKLKEIILKRRVRQLRNNLSTIKLKYNNHPRESQK